MSGEIPEGFREAMKVVEKRYHYGGLSNGLYAEFAWEAHQQFMESSSELKQITNETLAEYVRASTEIAKAYNRTAGQLQATREALDALQAQLKEMTENRDLWRGRARDAKEALDRYRELVTKTAPPKPQPFGGV